MRIFRFAVPVLLTLSLAACSGTWQGTPRSQINTVQAPDAPVGYRANPNRLVIKPQMQVAAVETAPIIAPAPAAAWNDLGDINQWSGGGTASSVTADGIGDDLAPVTGRGLPVLSPPAFQMPRGISYNDDVSVFPLDGASGDVITDALPTPFRSENYGVASDKPLYFAHGSAKVKKTDKKRLHTLAKKAKKKHRGTDVAVSVVGHASRRVDRVKDPLKKKMINFRMAQKRANAVTHELKAAGLKPAWVQAVSKGDEEPNPFPPPGMDAEAADRRVEVYMDEERQ